jgi:hypothetical protein
MLNNKPLITVLLAGAGLACASGADAALSSTGREFNPAVGLILNGHYAHYSHSVTDRQMNGFLLGPEAGLMAEGLSLDESELDVSSNIDDKFYGFSAISFGESDVSVEEAYLQTLTLPAGLTVKAGRFLSDVGYQNSHHAHTWDFIDVPVAYEAIMGGQYGDNGVQVSWLAPTDIYTRLGVELMNGGSFPAGGSADGGVGVKVVFAQFGSDVGDSNSWQAGVSWMSADAVDRESLNAGPTFTGNSDIAIAHFVWKWAPHGNWHDRNFKFQSEFLHRKEDGTVADGANSGAYSGTQNGWYLQGTWQWRPQWRVGLRYGQASADNAVAGLAAATPLAASGTPKRTSAMVDFSNSEFSLLRLQYNRDETGAQGDNQIYLQYIMSLGAHGAHQF